MLNEFHFASGIIAYEVKGNGPLLILLHGFGGNHNDWDESAEQLQKNYRVLVPRLVHVFFPKKGKHSFSAQVDIIAAFIAEVRERYQDEPPKFSNNKIQNYYSGFSLTDRSLEGSIDRR